MESLVAPAQAEQAAGTGVAPAVTPSSLKQDFAKEVNSANTPREIAALKAKMMPAMVNTLAQKDPKPPTETPAAPPETTPPAEETPPEVETPAPDAPVEPETPSGDEPDEAEDGGDGPVKPLEGNRARLRLSEKDQVGRLAASFMKRNRDLTMEEAVDRARDQLGIKPKAVETSPETPAQPQLPQTTAEVDAAIKALRADRRTALAEVRMEDASDISDKLEDLIQHRSTLERGAERKEIEQATAYNTAFTKSETKAIELYEFAGNPESEGNRRMAEIDAALKDNGDPLWADPDKPLRIAQMVAKELNIAPRRKGAPATPAKAAATATPTNGTAPKKQILPSGSSRTAAPIANQKPAIDAEIMAIKTPQDLRNMRRKLGLSV